MAAFAVTYRYTEDLAARDLIRPEHREFLRGLGDQLVVSGPTDDNGALIVVEAESADAALRLLDADPFAGAGLIAGRAVVGWTPVLGRWVAGR